MPRALPPPRYFLTRTDLVLTWLRAAAVGTACLVIVFVCYELVERAFFRDRMPTETLFAMHLARGITASVLVGTVSVAVVWWVRARYERAFAEAHRDLEQAMEARIAEVEQLQALARDQEKMAALGVLSAGIAHDIANPLASLSSELEMLEGETDVARVRASLGELRRQVSRIDRALREMTGFARRRADPATSVPLHVAVEDALRMVRHDPRARKIHIEARVAPDLPAVHAVEDHLVMVFVNLFLNAFDAMPDGGELRIEGRRGEAGATVSVRDTGAGMSPEVRERATQPFFTTKAPPEGDPASDVRPPLLRGGTGLGLSMSAGVVEAAGGKLTFDSEPGRGTEVTVWFPAPRAADTKEAS